MDKTGRLGAGRSRDPQIDEVIASIPVFICEKKQSGFVNLTRRMQHRHFIYIIILYIYRRLNGPVHT